jgi:hypothetical protein
MREKNVADFIWGPLWGFVDCISRRKGYLWPILAIVAMVRLAVYLSKSLSVYVAIYIPIYLFIDLFVHLCSIYPSIHPQLESQRWSRK